MIDKKAIELIRDTMGIDVMIKMIDDKTMPAGTIEIIAAHRDGTFSKVTMANVGVYEPSEDDLLRDMNVMNEATARMFREWDRGKL